MGNILSVLLLFAIGGVLGVHLPWWGFLFIGILLISFIINTNIEIFLLIVFDATPLVLGMIIGGVAYGDLGQLDQLIDFKFLLTGE